MHADDQTHRQQQPADSLPRCQLQPGDALADQHRERVERRTAVADAGTDVDDADRHHRVQPERQTHRDQQRHERHVLLGHPDRRRADGEQRHHTADQQHRPAAQPVNRQPDQRVDRPGRPQHPEHPADDQDEEDDVGRVGQAGRHRRQEREDRQRLRLDGVVGAADHLPAVALELPGRQHIGRHLGQQDQPADQDQ